MLNVNCSPRSEQASRAFSTYERGRKDMEKSNMSECGGGREGGEEEEEEEEEEGWCCFSVPPCGVRWDISLCINKHHHLQFGIYSLGEQSFLSLCGRN